MDIILLRGHKRSGNHLFVNWLTKLYATSEFHNDVYHETAPMPKEFIDGLTAGPFGDTDVVIFSTENPNLIPAEIVEYFVESSPVKAHSPHIIRDPFNWFASNIAKYEKFHGKKFDGKCDWGQWLIGYEIWKRDAIRIDYNKFVTSYEYRSSCADQLDRQIDPLLDQEIMNTLWCHPGVNFPSSFDSDRVARQEIQPREMQVLRRYEQYRDILKKYASTQILAIAEEQWGIAL